MTFANIYNEVTDDPSLIRSTPDDHVDESDNLPLETDTEEVAPPSNLQGITPEQQSEGVIGSPLKSIEPQVLPDITDPKIQEEMRDEQLSWLDLEGDEKQEARDAWIKKYYGSTKKYYDQFSLYGTSNPIENLDNVIQRLSSIGMGLPDFVSNVIGAFPGLAGADQAYDNFTNKIFNHPESPAIREVASIVLPSIVTGNITTGLIQKAGYAGKLTKLQQFGAGLGINSVLDSGIVGISDQGLEDNYFQKMYDSKFMNLFGKDQLLAIPEFLRTTDQDSAFNRRLKNTWADLPWSALGNLIGWGMAFKATPDGAPVLGWMEPLDEAAAAYKRGKILSVAEADDIKRMQEIEEALNSGKLSRADEAEAIDELITIEERTGKLTDIEDAIRIDDDIIKTETDLAAERKIADNGGEVPTDFDPDITPGVVDTTKGSVPIGNVARNMADQAAIRSGNSVGDPNPIITEATMQGLGVNDSSRKAVAGLASEKVGRFDALIDGFRYTNEEMRAASWANYAEIVDPNSTIDDIKALFAEGRDIKNIFMGKLQVEYISDEKFKGAMLALRDLMDVYTGKPVTETSANVMATLGAEIRTASETIERYAGIVDQDAALERVINKIQFLLDETALSKYISGWSLQNKNWINDTPIESVEEAARTIIKGFAREADSIHAKNLRFVNTLRKAKDIRPEVLRPLAAAFVLSDGKVDTISKLLRYAANEVSPLTLIKSPNPREMSLFSKSLFSVVFNNVLSAASVGRAAVSGAVQQVVKPLNSLTGSIFWGTINGDLPDQLRKTFYYYGAASHVHKQALKYAWNRMKAVHKDPTAMLRAGRKDFVFKTLKEREIIDDVREIWKADGNWGRVYQYDAIRGMHALAKMDWSRYPLVYMSGPDAYTQVVQAHLAARFRAYEDVFLEYGDDINEFALKRAEIKYKNSFFNKDDLLTDKLTQSLSDDINFTGDDALSSYITEAANAYPLLRFPFMFPRTESNAVKNALSYSPWVAIPGSTKHSKILYAGKDPNLIEAALLEHNVQPGDPHSQAIYEYFRNEYTGRLIFSGALTTQVWGYAMDGGITGPGHYNPAIRAYEERVFGLQYKTIKIPGTNQRFSFEGIPIVDPILSIIGNMVYYSKDLDGPILEDIHAKVFSTLMMGFGDNKLTSLNIIADIGLGNWSAVERLIKRAATATFIPAEVRQLTRAMDGALRDINENLLKYVQAQTPMTVGYVPKKLDPLFGNPVYDQENGWQRYMNEFTGQRFSQDERFDPDKENPFFIDLGDGNQRALTLRQAFRILQYPGFKKFDKNSLGTIKLTSDQREDLLEFVHADKDKNGYSTFAKELRSIVSSQKYHDHFAILREHVARNPVKQAPDLTLDAGNFPMFEELDALITNYIKEWENQAGLDALVEAQKEINFELGEGNINEAIDIQQQNTEKQQLLQYGGSR